MGTAQTILITGCSTGFGRALAEEAIAAGHSVVATARRPEQLADLLALAPERVRSYRLDVTDADQCRRAVAFAIEQFGNLGVVVNNAGYGLIGALEECSDEQILRNVMTNFVGPLNVIRAALPHFRSAKGGRIINMGAAAAIANYPGFSIYGGAKAALDLACESIALELAPYGVKITTVVPGPFRTDFIARSMDTGATPMAEYASTSGKFHATLKMIAGKQPGDPVKASKAILATLGLETPPLRLYLGKYAHQKVKKKLETVASELAASEPLGLGTEY